MLRPQLFTHPGDQSVPHPGVHGHETGMDLSPLGSLIISQPHFSYPKFQFSNIEENNWSFVSSSRHWTLVLAISSEKWLPVKSRKERKPQAGYPVAGQCLADRTWACCLCAREWAGTAGGLGGGPGVWTQSRWCFQHCIWSGVHLPPRTLGQLCREFSECAGWQALLSTM